MSSCVIKRNSKGKITRVLTPSGEVSTLFDKIAGIATVSDLNKAAEAYMTTYNDKFRSKFGDWVSNVRSGGLRDSLRFRIVGEMGMRFDVKALNDLDDAKRLKKIGFNDRDIWTWTNGMLVLMVNGGMRFRIRI